MWDKSSMVRTRYLDRGREGCKVVLMTTEPSKRYYVTAEIKPGGDVEIIRIEATPTLEHAHDGACDHVQFMRRVNQCKRPYGKLETEPLLRALAAWPLPVLKTIVGMR